MKRLLKLGLKSVSTGADRLMPRQDGVCILIYHRVGGGTSSEVDLPPSLFEEQMAVLAGEHEVVPLADALAALAAPPPPRGSAVTVAITFDDGTDDFTEQALPVLQRHRLPVTLYAATHFIETGEAFPWGASPLSWRQLADACSTGLVVVGSHTHRHLLLDRLGTDRIADELDRSQALLEQELQQPALHFAYPKALPPSAAADAAVRARFRSAALAGTRINPYGKTDAYLLCRSPIQRSDGMRYFEKKVRGGMGLEDQVRRLANRRRYAGAVT